MNVYRTEFFAFCPVNGIRIKYALRIESDRPIMVEAIMKAVGGFDRGFHEDIANDLLDLLGGKQTLIADHHGVNIETIRERSDRSAHLDQSVGGMAGTPGY